MKGWAKDALKKRERQKLIGAKVAKLADKVEGGEMLLRIAKKELAELMENPDTCGKGSLDASIALSLKTKSSFVKYSRLVADDLS